MKSRLGWNPFTLPMQIDIEGTARRTPSGFRADLAFRSADGKWLGSRALTSHEKECRSLGEAVAVAITVTIDPDASGQAQSVVAEQELPPEAEVPASLPLLDDREARLARVRVTLSGGASAGLIPGLSATASLRAGFIISDRFEVGVGAAYFPESRAGAYGFGMTMAEARGCVLPGGARDFLRLCGAVLFGAFESYAHSGELAPVDVGVFPWLGAEAGPVVSVSAFGPVRVELGATAVVPVIRRQGLVRGAPAPLWEESLVGFRTELGAGLLF